MPCPPRVIAVGAAVPAAVVPMPGDAAGVKTVVAVALLPRKITTVPFARTMPKAPSPAFPPTSDGPAMIVLVDASKIEGLIVPPVPATPPACTTSVRVSAEEPGMLENAIEKAPAPAPAGAPPAAGPPRTAGPVRAAQPAGAPR